MLRFEVLVFWCCVAGGDKGDVVVVAVVTVAVEDEVEDLKIERLLKKPIFCIRARHVTALSFSFDFLWNASSARRSGRCFVSSGYLVGFRSWAGGYGVGLCCVRPASSLPSRI